jgi:hypothetical protein
MVAVRRALIVQVYGLVIVAVTIAVLSRFPARGLVGCGAATGDALGRWSAICYPLLYACCNVLLLPAAF